MRCYSCDNPSGTKPFIDGKTGRCYCSTCWTVIQDDIRPEKDDDETSEVEVDEFDPQAVQTENNWFEHNLPVEED